MFSPSQMEQYRREGYAVYHDFLSPAEAAALRAELDAIAAGNTLASHDKTRMEMEPDQPPEGRLIRRLYEPCTHYPSFRALSDSAKLLDCVAQLLGPDLVFHYSKINMKPPHIGSVVEWHQDWSYYPLTNRDSVSILFYLDDAAVKNGCLQVIPRRHLGPLMDHTSGGFFRGRITAEVDESQALPLEGKAGSVIFMHCMTPHASVTNTSAQPRRTLILSYRAADAFPIYCGVMSTSADPHLRLVRGRWATAARVTETTIPVPRYETKIASLYELQAQARAAEQQA
ncbi:MAG: phytanoyl-CoA dioxygenase family protein [Candidatus Handelsmanbacteria bacterium]|nr:phytanoyl-CoA dioxygenase family protein [Candidatus Handelsmanbacteria bacterium]